MITSPTNLTRPSRGTFFGKCLSGEGQTVAQFIHRLREQAALCAFGERTVSGHLRDQVVEQVKDERLGRKLLEKEDLTLQIALDTARQFETTEASAQGIQQMLSIQAKDKGRSQSSRPQKREECANCGSFNHSAGDDDLHVGLLVMVARTRAFSPQVWEQKTVERLRREECQICEERWRRN